MAKEDWQLPVKRRDLNPSQIEHFRNKRIEAAEKEMEKYKKTKKE